MWSGVKLFDGLRLLVSISFEVIDYNSNWSLEKREKIWGFDLVEERFM